MWQAARDETELAVESADAAPREDVETLERHVVADAPDSGDRS